MSRVTLNYSAELTSKNTFFLLADRFTIRASLAEANSGRHVVELPLRRQKPARSPKALHVRPLDSELATWLVESSVVHADLARMELLLTNVPADVSWALLEL